ncbi:MAG: alpha/beta hydrolase [Ardenticatenaceae bacterium]|nr:alpha/beta hydrolase [Anaerolineales bacterium]MCB8922083.1 alpha/beta hydrolase [Ardenticatenaceae bacterium]MCB9003199.1 alpha/beta hydrolase [Ardenticatenaceae bacterium]
MSSIVTEQGILHYESIGRGQPVILLHGWINSWDVWRDSMIALAKTGIYRVYALDFWGFGDSATGTLTSTTSFQISSYVEMVYQFMETLGIQQTPILGHSMGGTVALQMALTYPERVSKVAVVGSPVVGRSLNPFLQLAGYGAIAKLVWRYPIMLRSIMRILLARDSKKVRNMIFRDVQRTTMESFFRSIGDLRETDLRADLPSLKIPTMGIYGTRDNIVSPNNAKMLCDNVLDNQVSMMHSSRHFPMVDEPENFLSALDSFLQDAKLEAEVEVTRE